ncbi:TauD/TfdA family dioxygenase [Microdochium nivale]|nr:TauD/TfdA family dioxygenase [Microdochium nivale]
MGGLEKERVALCVPRLKSAAFPISNLDLQFRPIPFVVPLSTPSTMGYEKFEITSEGVPESYYTQGLRRRYQLDSLKSEQATTVAAIDPPADIGYDVDEEAFKRRWAKTTADEHRATTVPDGWPQQLDGPLVWDAADFHNEDEFVYQLTDTDNAEIRGALEFFKEQGVDGMKVSQQTFPLHTLGLRLESVRDEVYDGRGFVIVRGLDPDSYSVEDLTVVYLGISSYVGERRGKQDQRGSMLMHVIRRNDERDGQYSEDKPFHTDTVTDCLCLFTRSLASEGGRSVLASSWKVYNELAATRPDLIHVLAEPNWPFDTFGRDPPFYKRALMYYSHGKLITSFSRRLLVGHEPFDPRSAGIPALTELQAEALDAVHFTAKRFEVKPRMLKGDLRFINNMGILHRREAFENGAGKARHLVRIWLNNEMLCWKLPRELRLAWARVFDEDEERSEFWDIEPPRKDGKILRVAGTCD